MSKDIQKTALRLPRDLHTAIHDAASSSGRTMNAEIIYRLQRTFDEDAALANLDGVKHVNDIGRHLVHDVVLTDPNIPPKWNPEFVEEMREVLDFVRKMRDQKGNV